jgi:hypothetical protein
MLFLSENSWFKIRVPLCFAIELGINWKRPSSMCIITLNIHVVDSFRFQQVPPDVSRCLFSRFKITIEIPHAKMFSAMKVHISALSKINPAA